jgi:excisionase family DNA binding protein
MRPLNTPVAYTVPNACQASGIGTTKMYELIGLGTLDARKAGRRTLITADSLHAYLEGLPRAEVRAPRQRAA